MFKRRKSDDATTDDGTKLNVSSREDRSTPLSPLGVPPFRPAYAPPPPAPPPATTTTQEAQMGRAPFPAPPSPNAAPAPRPGTAIPPGPQLAPPGLAQGGAPRASVGDKRTLVVGRGISVQGTVQDCERLVVEGTVEASLIHAAELHVSPGGVFRGEVQVTDAEVAGTIDGTLTASGNLIIRATGRLLGTAKCRRLQVEDGGQVTGRLEMLNEPAPHSAAPPTDPFRPAPQLPEPAAVSGG